MTDTDTDLIAGIDAAVHAGAMSRFIPEPETLLGAATTPALLRAAYALTHRIHEADARRDAIGDRHDLSLVDLRAQRDLIDAEVLRRTGDAS